VAGNPDSICGDITAFNIDPNTGRLSLITNQQVKNSAGTNLTYFPVGSGPINFTVIPSNSYIYTIEKGQANSPGGQDPPQAVFVYANSGGQLTLTQNTPIPSSAESLSFIYASSKYVYLIDTQGGTTAGQILPYTVGTNGALQSLVGGQVENPGPESHSDQPSELGERLLHRPDDRAVDHSFRRSQFYQYSVRFRFPAHVHPGRSVEPVPLHGKLCRQHSHRRGDQLDHWHAHDVAQEIIVCGRRTANLVYSQRYLVLER
jgi:hypothetical protein